MKYKTFLEVMAGRQDGELNLTHSQKRVLRKSLEAQDPRMSAVQVLNAEDSRNLITASKVLAKYGYITTTPEELGQGAETINGSASVQTTTTYGVIEVYSDGTNWFADIK